MSDRIDPPDNLKEAKRAGERTAGRVSDRVSSDRPGRSAGGSHVDEGGDDTPRTTVRGGGATPFNTPIFGVGVAVVILVLLIIAWFVFG